MAENKATPTWTPFQKGELYNLHAERWQLELDTSEWTLDVLESGKYLDEFSSQENKDDYAYRRRMSAPLDMCRDGVQIRVDNLWRRPPVRQVGNTENKTLIEELIADADAEGTSLNEFMRTVTWDYYVNGVDIVTQVTPSESEIATLADEQAEGIRPFFQAYHPLQRFDWATNGAGNFEWARYSLGMVQRPGEQSAPTQTFNFLSLNKENWTLWQVDKATGEDRVTSLAKGPHGLNIPPIIKAYFASSRKSGQGAVPLSLLTRPAVIARVLLNMKSQADADLLAAVTRWIVTGADVELPDTFGPNVVWRIPAAEATVTVSQGDYQHIKEKREWVRLYIGEILRLLKFRGGMAEISASQGSGLKLALERTDFENELRSTASQMEATELEMMRQAVWMQTGKEIAKEDAAETLQYSVHYNTDYVLEPLGEMLDNIKRWFLEAGAAVEDVPAIGRELLSNVANLVIQEGTERHTDAMAQIEATNFSGLGGIDAEANG